MKVKPAKNIAQFYDNFVDTQRKTGINLRMYSIYKHMLSLGLRSTDEVLELGAGIGSITRLICRKVKKGKVESVDISEASVQWAQHKIKKPQLRFYCGDVVDYVPVYATQPKWVTLFDVIEHIPIERHAALFEQIDSYLPQGGSVLINIPAPEHIEYDREHQPDALQIIDQPVYLNELLKNLENTELQLTYFEKYSLWQKGDYHFIIIRKKQPFSNASLPFSWKTKYINYKLKWLQRWL